MTREEISKLISDWPNSELIFKHFSTQEEDLEPLLEVVFDDSKAVHWRAAWIVDKIQEKDPERIAGYLPQIQQAVFNTTNKSKLRHYLKMISQHPIDPNSAGLLFEKAYQIFTDARFAVAVRVHAMQILYEISQIEKDLKPELIQIIEQEIELHPSPGIKSRGTRILKLLYLQTSA